MGFMYFIEDFPRLFVEVIHLDDQDLVMENLIKLIKKAFVDLLVNNILNL